MDVRKHLFAVTLCPMSTKYYKFGIFEGTETVLKSTVHFHNKPVLFVSALGSYLTVIRQL